MTEKAQTLMPSTEQFSVLDAHLGRDGNNQFDVAKLVEISRSLLQMAIDGQVVIIDIDPPSPQVDKLEHLTAFIDAIEAGQVEVEDLLSLARARKGHKREDGVRVTYVSNGSTRHLSLRWNIA